MNIEDSKTTPESTPIDQSSSPQLLNNATTGLTSELASGIKSYNPLSGRELAGVLARRALEGFCLIQESGIYRKTSYFKDLEPAIKLSLQRTFPQLEEELISFPRADVEFDLGFSLTEHAAIVEYRLKIIKYPQEEGRVLAGEGRINFAWTGDIEKFDRISVNLRCNTDEIPPDASRILADLPVPTPTKVSGSGGLSGETSIVDVPKMASEKEKDAVKEKFGKKAK